MVKPRVFEVVVGWTVRMVMCYLRVKRGLGGRRDDYSVSDCGGGRRGGL